jgi:GH15 family glucan-1,4-alpha-glucosidase
MTETPTRPSGETIDLTAASLAIIRAGQDPSGAFIASPNFPAYRYCWFRDSTFIAQALDLWGDHEAARRFYDWGTATILRHANDVRLALKTPAGASPSHYLHTRYNMDGAFGDEEWPNFQLDGFGTFLWGMAEHLEPESLTTGSTSASEAPAPTSESHQVRQPGSGWYEAAELIATYLTHLWRTPNFDCWEEFSDQVHVSTLCAIYGGLSRAGRCFGREEWRATADEIKNFVREHCAGSGYLTKFIGSDTLDSSLLWAAVPFNMFDARESLMVGTIQRVQTDLVGPDGGVHRYAADSYYGGGLWILLTAALGEDLLAQANLTAARSMLAWIEGRAWDDGSLPEQVPEVLIVPEQFEPWLQERGPIARPLLWSHAAYLRLRWSLMGLRDPEVAEPVSRAISDARKDVASPERVGQAFAPTSEE